MRVEAFGASDIGLKRDGNENPVSKLTLRTIRHTRSRSDRLAK